VSAAIDIDRLQVEDRPAGNARATRAMRIARRGNKRRAGARVPAAAAVRHSRPPRGAPRGTARYAHRRAEHGLHAYEDLDERLSNHLTFSSKSHY
jgi:hypothetical protein